jgi:hypothetical protein
MVKARASTLIATSTERVFEFVVSDFAANYRRWSPEVERLDLLTPGPMRVGSRARQIRCDRGRRSDTTFRVVALEPHNRVGFAECSNLFVIDYLMDPIDEQTRLTFVFELTRMELYMRPFEKLIRRAIQDGAERTVRNIKALVERASALPVNPQT